MDYTHSEQRHQQLTHELRELQNQLETIMQDIESARAKGHDLSPFYKVYSSCEEKIDCKKREIKECQQSTGGKPTLLYDTQSMLSGSSVQRKDNESLVIKQRSLHHCRHHHDYKQ